MKTKKLAPWEISSVKVETVNFDVSLITEDKKLQAEIEKLLPENLHEKITFTVNGPTAFANSFRREVISGLTMKCLHVDIDDIESNEDFLKRHEFCKRIAFIPVNQKIPLDAKFTISVKNNDVSSNRLIVHSSEIKNEKYQKYFDSTFRIAELHPGKYLKAKITVCEGISRDNGEENDNAKFSPISNVEYHILDYKHVWF